MAWQLLGAFLGVVGFSIVLQVPKKYLVYAGFIGAIGWFVYLLLQDEFLYMAYFVSAVFISLGAQIMARILKTPVTIFNIAGIMPLVPGAGMYQIVYSIIEANGMTSFYFSQTIQIAGVISMAIFLTDVIFRAIWKRGLR